MPRAKLLEPVTTALPPFAIGMEACSAAHHQAHQFAPVAGIALRVRLTKGLDRAFRRTEALLPGEVQLLPGRRALPQGEIHETAIRNTCLFRHRLEIGDRVLIKTDRDRLLDLCRIGVLPRGAEVALFATRSNSPKTAV